MGFEKEASSSSHILAIPGPGAGEVTSSSPLLSDYPKSHLSSPTKTFANVFIAIVGAGVLGLPYTFMRTGWVAGVAILVSVAALTYHSLLLLVRTRRQLQRDNSSKIQSFGDLGFAVSGRFGRAAVDTMIVLSQAGFCVSYFLFIADTLAHIINGSNLSTPKARPPHLSYLKSVAIKPRTMYVWAMLPFQLGMNSIRTLTHLAPLSIFADVAEVGAMGVVMVKDVGLYLDQQPALKAFTSLSVFFYGAGVAIYCFEGVGMVLPLESEAADKSKFGASLGLSMFVITTMYAIFGVLGYMAFGEDTKDIITTNLGTGLITNMVQIGLCVNLFISFPVMMNPVYEVVERRFSGHVYSLWRRWVVVVAVALVAVLVPNFADFLSIVGSSVCCILGLVLPPLFHLRSCNQDVGLGWVVSDVAMVVAGTVFAVSGTISTLLEIITR